MPDMQAHSYGLAELNCRDFMEYHAEYIDGIVPAGRARQFDAHATSCRSCGQYDRVIRRGLLLARNLPEIQPSGHFHENLQHRLMGLDAEGPQPIKASNATVVVIAAVLVLVAVTPLMRLVPEERTTPADAVPIAAFGAGDFSELSNNVLVRGAGN